MVNSFSPRAHEGLAGPFAAAIVVDRVDVVEAGDQRAPQHGLAAARGDVPPALGGPALVLLVADRDPDPVAGVVAEAEIGLGRLDRRREGRIASSAAQASAGPARRTHRTNFRPGMQRSLIRPHPSA